MLLFILSLIVLQQNPCNLKLNFRLINETDIDLLFRWCNDPVVRNQSFNSSIISYEDHITWFNNKITSKSSMLYIFNVDEVPAGLVRFDRLVDETVIGVLIDTNFRGLGLASKMLSISVEEYISKYKVSISAYIKNTNHASIKAFKKAGFIFSKEEIIGGCLSVKFLYNFPVKIK